MNTQNTQYEIPFEHAEFAHGLVGKTLIVKGSRRVEIVSWQGQNYTIVDKASGKTGEYPVEVIIDQINHNLMRVE